VEERPNEARYPFFLGSFLSRFGLFDDAEKYLSHAVELSPNKQQIIYELGNVKIAKRELDEGLKLFEKAYNLDKRNDEAAILYAAAAIYKGDAELTDTILMEQFSATVYPDERLANSYLAIRNTLKAIEVYEALLEKYPEHEDGIKEIIERIKSGDFDDGLY
jgi:tetratricopeptide (TPR) repeat protein